MHEIEHHAAIGFCSKADQVVTACSYQSMKYTKGWGESVHEAVLWMTPPKYFDNILFVILITIVIHSSIII